MLNTAYQQFGASSANVGSLQGSRISLVSKSEIRYEGYLYSISPEENTIALRNVRMFGTEGRRREGPQIPPGDQLYEFIIFRGSDIKDLTVFDAAASQSSLGGQSALNDPAVVNAWKAAPGSDRRASNNDWNRRPGEGSRRSYQDPRPENRNWNQPRSGPAPGSYQQNRSRYQERSMQQPRDEDYPRQQITRGQGRTSAPPQARLQRGQGRERVPQRNSGSAAARPQRKSGRSRRTYGYNFRRSNMSAHTGQNFQPNESAPARLEFSEDFDFETSNQKLDRSELAREGGNATSANPKYNKEKSFFDDISCEASDKKDGGDAKKVDKSVREQQKLLNLETFGSLNLNDRTNAKLGTTSPAIPDAGATLPSEPAAAQKDTPPVSTPQEKAGDPAAPAE
eukprot:NODE_1746_length_1419_cov_24.051825_g1575_i0.p1 GENE.NODE_1746_length_1419_cov_24.051825_g1575_i0~~NODE_1746_length_1419_cov_24.051825_g1575_i0.p1  ORF type:complete len:396 (-),score=55.43 NODE_1746_length_1419_cov_24.051825_g1575_i0:157-1344(-)